MRMNVLSLNMTTVTRSPRPVLRLFARASALILAVVLTVELAIGLRQTILDAYRDIASAPQFANAPQLSLIHI